MQPLLLSMAMSATLTTPATARTAGDVAQAATGAIRALDLQRELPHQPLPVAWHIHLPPELLWAIVIIGALLLLYFFIQEIPGLRLARRGGWEEAGGEGEAAAATPAAAMVAADELARHGRYAEAMHALLLQALAELRRRSDEPFADSLTSREILRHVRLPEPGRAALRDVVGRVERSHFGEHPAGAEDYAGCRASFDALGRVLGEVAA